MRRIASYTSPKAQTLLAPLTLFAKAANKALVHNQSAPTDRKRRHTARQVLKLVGGQHLKDRSRVHTTLLHSKRPVHQCSVGFRTVV